MICGKCKASNVDVAHVKGCYQNRAKDMTDKQRSYIEALIRQKNLDVEQINSKFGFVVTDCLRHEASDVINYLKGVKAEPPQPSGVPDGRYALWSDDKQQWEFYKVRTPETGQWRGYTFVEVQASDDFWPIRNRETLWRILERIAEDPLAASKAYGKELGRCGVCGRTLTDPESIAAGIGPICAAKSF